MTIEEAISLFQYDSMLEEAMYNEEFYEELVDWLKELMELRKTIITTDTSLEAIRKEAYMNGRADKYQEITSQYMLLTEEQVKDIRTNAIEEFLEMLKNPFTIDSILATHDKFTLYAIFKRVAEQLKEERHENIRKF